MNPNQAAAEKVVKAHTEAQWKHTLGLVAPPITLAARITALLDAKDAEAKVLWAECEEARKILPVRRGRYIRPVFIAREYGGSDWINRMLATRAATDAMREARDAT